MLVDDLAHAEGGLARVSTLRKRIMQESPNTLFLLSGDTISPSVESITYKGRQMIDAWNQVGLDYSVFGNHEFDYGDAELLKRVKESKFKWLGANVIDTAANYRFQRSERSVGEALRRLSAAGFARDELVVCTKGGYLPFDGEPCAAALTRGDARRLRTARG